MMPRRLALVFVFIALMAIATSGTLYLQMTDAPSLHRAPVPGNGGMLVWEPPVGIVSAKLRRFSGSAGTNLTQVGGNGFQTAFTRGMGATVEMPSPMIVEQTYTQLQSRSGFVQQAAHSVSSNRYYQYVGPVTHGPTGFELCRVFVPVVKELTIADARTKIRDLDFEISIDADDAREDDLVLEASPSSGLANYRSTIVIRSVGVRVPEILTIPLGEADEKVVDVRLQPKRDNTVRPHHPVTKMSPEAGTIVPKGTPVQYYSQLQAPRLIGLVPDDVQAKLAKEDLGLVEQIPAKLSDDVICDQNPRPNVMVNRGVGIRVEMGPLVPQLVGLSLEQAQTALQAKILDGKIANREARIVRTINEQAFHQHRPLRPNPFAIIGKTQTRNQSSQRFTLVQYTPATTGPYGTPDSPSHTPPATPPSTPTPATSTPHPAPIPPPSPTPHPQSRPTLPVIDRAPRFIRIPLRQPKEEPEVSYRYLGSKVVKQSHRANSPISRSVMIRADVHDYYERIVKTPAIKPQRDLLIPVPGGGYSDGGGDGGTNGAIDDGMNGAIDGAMGGAMGGGTSDEISDGIGDGSY